MRVLGYLGLASVICGSDLAIKETVKKKVGENSQKYILDDKVILTKFYNRGAALGVLQENPEWLRAITIFGVGSLAGAMAFACGQKGHHLKKIGLSMMLGGASSNAYERLKFGKVTDYIKFNVENKKLRNIIYNLGDFAIFSGTMLLLAGELIEK